MNTIIVLSLLGIATLFTGVYNLRKFIVPFVILGLLLALGITIFDASSLGMHYHDMLNFDRFSVVFSSLMIGLTLLLFLFYNSHHEDENSNIADPYGLMIFALVGGVVLSSYYNLSMLFLGIEILSIPLYILAGSNKGSLLSNEAGIKYFTMGAFSTGFLLFGIALIYGATNTFHIGEIGSFITTNSGHLPVMFQVGLLLILVALAFKVSAVPFHFWAPDVYDGAPTWVTAFMASVVKVAGFAAFYRLFYLGMGEMGELWQNSLWIIAALTIVTGNLMALFQKSVKRMLAYSGISNAGFILLALLAINEKSSEVLLYYLAAYAVATIAAFAVLMAVEREKDNNEFAAFSNLAHTNPWMAAVMTISMLSLAGIPPLAGFFGKYYLFANAVSQGYIWIVVLAVIASLAGVYYYFKVIVSMFSHEDHLSVEIEVKPTYNVGLFIAAAVTVILGLAPALLLDLL